MARIDLSVQQLEAFSEIVRRGGFRAAASTLHVSQPALSRTIQLAEQALGTRLFDRGTNGVELTPAGRQLMPIARRILGDFDASRGELAEFIQGRSGRVDLAVLPSIGVAVMPAAIVRFHKDYPGVRFGLRGLSAGPLETAVAEGTVDFGVSVRPPAGANLAFEQILSDSFVLLCRPDDPLAEHLTAPWSVFMGRPFVATATSSSIRVATDAVFSQKGMVIEQLYESGNVSITAAIVAAGLGITALPLWSLALIDQTNLTTRPLVDPIVFRQIGLLTRTNRSLSTAAERLRDDLMHNLRATPTTTQT